MREDVKKVYVAVVETAKFLIHWGFVPTIVYLGSAIIYYSNMLILMLCLIE